ncbi:MAG TPA: right-handed parallel beta-helix repeat-containing protein [Gammaproteobacteria bacterium]
MQKISILYKIILLTALVFHAEAETYYVNQADGLDTNSGLSLENPWKSIARVNSHIFNPGDNILFHRGQKWRETLVPPTSGTELNPVYFGAYGEGVNPVILRTDRFSDWKLVQTDNSKSKIWEGRIPKLRNSWGIIIDGQRLPVHKQYDKVKLSSLNDRYFYSPLNKNVFYLRNDTGNPGIAEIGARKAAIIVENKHHVVIENIDAFGPGGRATSGGSTGYMNVMIIGNSSYITLKNMTVSHGNSIGVSAKSDTTNIKYLNLISHDNASTGIYMNSQNGLIKDCRSFNNGIVASDSGDRGGIGSFKGSNINIENNIVHSNGPINGNADYEISIVGTGRVSIQRNFIYDCRQGCLQIAEGGDDSIISYNIISGYGTAMGKMTSIGKLSGIRIGGGTSGSKNIQILNNIIHNGHQSSTSREAGIFITNFDNSGLSITNNIFSDNINKHVYIQGKDISKFSFSHNLYQSNEIPFGWHNKDIYSLTGWRNKLRLDANSIAADPAFINKSGVYNQATDFMLKPMSPAIRKGNQDKIMNTDYFGNVIDTSNPHNIGVDQTIH